MACWCCSFSRLGGCHKERVNRATSRLILSCDQLVKREWRELRALSRRRYRFCQGRRRAVGRPMDGGYGAAESIVLGCAPSPSETSALAVIPIQREAVWIMLA